MKLSLLFLGVFILCIDLSRNSTLTRDEFIARRNRILEQRQGRNNEQSNTPSRRGQNSNILTNRDVQNPSTNNRRISSPNASNRRLSNRNQNSVQTRITTNVNTNVQSERANEQQERSRFRQRFNRNNRQRTRINSRQRNDLNIGSRTRINENRLRPSNRQRFPQLRNRQQRGDDVRPSRRGSTVNNDISGINPNSLNNNARDSTSDSPSTPGFDNDISRVILTPVQDGAVRSLRTLLNSGRRKATPRLIGFLIPRADGRTQLRLMRDGNLQKPGPLPINLRTILDAARRANLLPSRNGTRVRSASSETNIGGATSGRGNQRQGSRRRQNNTPDQTTNIDQRRVNIEVNVNNQGSDASNNADSQNRRQRNRQRQRNNQRRLRGNNIQRNFGSVTPSPFFDSVTPTAPNFQEQQNLGRNNDIPRLPRRDFQNTFGETQRGRGVVASSNSVPIGTGRDNPPDPFNGRGNPSRGRIGAGRLPSPRAPGVEIPPFSGSFSRDIQEINTNSLETVQPQSRTLQSNSLRPISPLDAQSAVRSNSVVDSEGVLPQRARSRSRSRRPNTRVFQPQAAVNDFPNERDFRTLPPALEQPMVQVDSFNQIQRQPQIMNADALPAAIPTAPQIIQNRFGDPTAQQSGTNVINSNVQLSSSISPSQQPTGFRRPPFVQPVTEQTGAPTILNSQTRSVIQVPNIPSFGQGIAVDASTIGVPRQSLTGQISANMLDVSPSQLITQDTNIDSQGRIGISLNNTAQFSNASFPSNLILQLPSNISSILKEQATRKGIGSIASSSQLNNLGALVDTSNSTSDSISVRTEINASAVLQNTGGDTTLAAPQIAVDPAPVIIDSKPNIHIMTDAAVNPILLEATVKVPAIQTPDQIALAPETSIGITDVSGVSQTNISLPVDPVIQPVQGIPTGPPPPIPIDGVVQNEAGLTSQSLPTNENLHHQFQNPINRFPSNIDAQIAVQNLPNPQLPRSVIDQQNVFNGPQGKMMEVPVQFGNRINAMNMFSKVMNDLQSGANTRQLNSGAIPQQQVDMQALKSIIMEVLITFFRTNGIDPMQVAKQGPNSAIQLVEKVVVDAATSHIGPLGPRKKLVEQSIKATVRNTLQELAAIPKTTTNNVSSANVHSAQFSNHTPPQHIPTANPVVVIDNFQSKVSNSPDKAVNTRLTNIDPIVSASIPNAANSGTIGIKVLPLLNDTGNGLQNNLSATENITQVSVDTVSTSKVHIIDKSPGTVGDAVPDPTIKHIPPAIIISPATEQTVKTTIVTSSTTQPSSTTPFRSSTIPPSTTNAATSVTQTADVTNTTPTLPTSNTVSQSVSTVSSTLAQTSTIVTTTVPPASVQNVAVSDVGTIAVSTTILPLISQSTVQKRLTAPKIGKLFKTSRNTSIIVAGDTTIVNGMRGQVNIIEKSTPVKIEIPAPPPALRNPWLSRFPRHSNFSLTYRMPKNTNQRIAHNVLNQGVVIKSLPIPSDPNKNRNINISEIRTLKSLQMLQSPAGASNLKAHAIKFGLVGHGGDIVRSADVGKPGGLPVFLPGTII